MTFSLRLNIFRREIAFNFSTRKARTGRAYGYTNRCEDGKYILCLDYDKMTAEMIYSEIIALINDFQLSDVHIFKSSKDSFHAVCLDKFTYTELIRIMRCTTTDMNYINVATSYGKRLWTLRTTPKDRQTVRYQCSIKGQYNNRQQSYAHFKLLQKLHGNNLTFPNSPDKSEKLIFSTYPI